MKTLLPLSQTECQQVPLNSCNGRTDKKITSQVCLAPPWCLVTGGGSTHKVRDKPAHNEGQVHTQWGMSLFPGNSRQTCFSAGGPGLRPRWQVTVLLGISLGAAALSLSKTWSWIFMLRSFSSTHSMSRNENFLLGRANFQFLALYSCIYMLSYIYVCVCVCAYMRMYIYACCIFFFPYIRSITTD